MVPTLVTQLTGIFFPMQALPQIIILCWTERGIKECVVERHDCFCCPQSPVFKISPMHLVLPVKYYALSMNRSFNKHHLYSKPSLEVILSYCPPWIVFFCFGGFFCVCFLQFKSWNLKWNSFFPVFWQTYVWLHCLLTVHVMVSLW